MSSEHRIRKSAVHHITEAKCVLVLEDGHTHPSISYTFKTHKPVVGQIAYWCEVIHNNQIVACGNGSSWRKPSEHDIYTGNVRLKAEHSTLPIQICVSVLLFGASARTHDAVFTIEE